MRIIMFRHAERENSGGTNPPLSLRGLRQAEKLVDEIDLQSLPRPTKLLSSPKLRAQQTFQQIQNKLGVDLQTFADLDERQRIESPAAFTRRVQKFLTLLEAQVGVVFFVTHLDWIEEALRLIHADVDLKTDRFQGWPPARSIEFEIQDRHWIFQELRDTDV
jgi:broad specificity phosphatase PhoE